MFLMVQLLIALAQSMPMKSGMYGSLEIHALTFSTVAPIYLVAFSSVNLPFSSTHTPKRICF